MEQQSQSTIGSIETISDMVCKMPLCADAVEFRPSSNEASRSSSSTPLLACATYQLDTNTRKRDGAVYFFRMETRDGAHKGDGGQQNLSLRNVDKVHQVGVLDIKVR